MHILYDVWIEIRARRHQEIVANMENDVDRARRELMYAHINEMFQHLEAIKQPHQERNDIFYQRIEVICDLLSNSLEEMELMKSKKMIDKVQNAY